MSSPFSGMQPALRLTDLTVGYGGRKKPRVVLQHLRAQVARGELVCLLGTNGAGKSSLIRTIARIQPALGGSIEIDGTDIRKVSSLGLARTLGVVLTDRTDVGNLPAYRIVELGRYSHQNWAGTAQPRDAEVVRWALNAVGAGHLENRNFDHLSDGERQRIMIARALAQEPTLLLLDEPTAFLDVASRVELLGLLMSLARENHLAVVLSTHDLEIALRMADTIWLVDSAGHFRSGTPEDLVLAGHIGSAFESKNVSFQPEERAFRLHTGTRGKALVRGEGLPALLAETVIEREGFELGGDSTNGLEVTIAADATWQVLFADGSSATGKTYGELACSLRAPQAGKSQG